MIIYHLNQPGSIGRCNLQTTKGMSLATHSRWRLTMGLSMG